MRIARAYVENTGCHYPQNVKKLRSSRGYLHMIEDMFRFRGNLLIAADQVEKATKKFCREQDFLLLKAIVNVTEAAHENETKTRCA